MPLSADQIRERTGLIVQEAIKGAGLPDDQAAVLTALGDLVGTRPVMAALL